MGWVEGEQLGRGDSGDDLIGKQLHGHRAGNDTPYGVITVIEDQRNLSRTDQRQPIDGDRSSVTDPDRRHCQSSQSTPDNNEQSLVTMASTHSNGKPTGYGTNRIGGSVNPIEKLLTATGTQAPATKRL